MLSPAITQMSPSLSGKAGSGSADGRLAKDAATTRSASRIKRGAWNVLQVEEA